MSRQRSLLSSSSCSDKLYPILGDPARRNMLGDAPRSCRFRAGLSAAHSGRIERPLQQESDRDGGLCGHHLEPAVGRGAGECSHSAWDLWPGERFRSERFTGCHAQQNRALRIGRETGCRNDAHGRGGHCLGVGSRSRELTPEHVPSNCQGGRVDWDPDADWCWWQRCRKERLPRRNCAKTIRSEGVESVASLLQYGCSKHLRGSNPTSFSRPRDHEPEPWPSKGEMGVPRTQEGWWRGWARSGDPRRWFSRSEGGELATTTIRRSYSHVSPRLTRFQQTMGRWVVTTGWLILGRLSLEVR